MSIYLEVTTQNRHQTTPKVSYMRFNEWAEALEYFAERVTGLHSPWHTFKLHAISEAQYRRENMNELPGMPPRRHKTRR